MGSWVGKEGGRSRVAGSPSRGEGAEDSSGLRGRKRRQFGFRFHVGLLFFFFFGLGGNWISGLGFGSGEGCRSSNSDDSVGRGGGGKEDITWDFSYSCAHNRMWWYFLALLIQCSSRGQYTGFPRHHNHITFRARVHTRCNIRVTGLHTCGFHIDIVPASTDKEPVHFCDRPIHIWFRFRWGYLTPDLFNGSRKMRHCKRTYSLPLAEVP